jgi:D-xylose transport system substrate-binding protein
MKKILSLSVLALAGLAVVLTGCQPAAPKKLTVGLSLPTQREARWVSDKNTMVEAATAAGIDLKVQTADADMAQQATQVEALLSQGIQVLILAPHDGGAAATLVDKAHKQGIKVISYDRLILNTDVDMYTSFDNVKVGELQGEWIVKQAPKGNYIVMSGDPGDNNAKLFKQGAMKFLQPLVDKGDIKIVADQAVANWLPSNALNIVENALTANKNKVDAILAPNDGTAGGAIQALTAQKLQGKVPVTGQDAEAAAAKRINEGTQGMTVFKDTRELGKGAVAAAITYAQGKTTADIAYNGVKVDQVVNNGKIDVPSLLLPATVITKENVQVLVDSGYLKAEDIK